MFNMPLNVVLHKDKMLICSNGSIRTINAPNIDIILPSDQYKDLPICEDPYFFVGVAPYSHDNPHVCALKEAVRYTMSHEEWKQGASSKLPFSYTDYILLTKKELLREYAHKSNLKMMYYDIEVASDGTGMFPKASRNSVAMIGLEFSNGIPPSDVLSNIKHVEQDGKIVLYAYDPTRAGLEDYQLLVDFDSVVKYMDPDIIVGYNSWTFDMPYILTRLMIHNMQCYGLQGISEAETKKDTYLHSHYTHCRNPENDFNVHTFGRRLHYDILHVDIFRDQKLTGKVKDKKMKTIAQYFYPKDEHIVVLDTPEMENIAGMMTSEDGTKTLIEYLFSDITQTKRLADIYFTGNNVQNAQELEVPLGTIVGRRNGTIPTLYMLSNMFKSKIIPLSINMHMFNSVIQRAENEFKEDKLFQGAYVDILRTGKIPRPIYKVDFACLSEDTEVLTTLGWKTYKELTPDIAIAEFDANTDAAIWSYDYKVLEYDYNGPMIRIHNKLIDKLVTPNHRVLHKYVKTERKVKNRLKRQYKSKVPRLVYRVDTASNLRVGIQIPCAAIGIMGIKYNHFPIAGITAGIITKDEAVLLGWILTEGWLSKHGTNIYISQSSVNMDNVNNIRAILGLTVGTDFFTERHRHRTNSRGKYIEYVFMIRSAKTKYIMKHWFPAGDIHIMPTAIMVCPPDILTTLFRTMIQGDGSVKKVGTYVYGSKRKQLADYMQAICAVIGMRSHLRKSKHHQDMYYLGIHSSSTVSIGTNSTRMTKDSIYNRVPYTGKVWCLSTSTGYFICRRNGQTFVTGNSLYPSIIRTFNLSYETVSVEYTPLDGEISDDIDQYQANRIVDPILGDILDISYNDKILHVRAHVTIKMNTRGVIPAILDELITSRKNIRKQMKDVDPTSLQYKIMDSAQIFRKVLANSVYGILSQKTGIGFLPVGMTVTALGRWAAKTVATELEKPDSSLLVDSEPDDGW